jgi:hypothetical protein
MKKLLLLGATALLMAACSESSTAPGGSRRAPSSAKFDEEFTCKSGYVIAYDENGDPYCVPVTDGGDGAGQGGNSMLPPLQSGIRAPLLPKGG